MSAFPSHLRFAARYALCHLGISLVVALISAALVFGVLYPWPYRTMLGVGSIFMLMLVVDVVCGPLLTSVLANPRKSRRERWLDFSLVGLIQMLALAYGLHSVWVARPVVLAYEKDRLVVVTANEIDPTDLPNAPDGFRNLPWAGLLQVGTRDGTSAELLDSVQRSLAGESPAMRPGWWVPKSQQLADMNARAKPLAELVAHRPQDADILRAAAKDAGADPANLRYLPLTSSKTKDWVALLDAKLDMVGYAPVDGF